jgi:hypothetical protein
MKRDPDFEVVAFCGLMLGIAYIGCHIFAAILAA